MQPEIRRQTPSFSRRNGPCDSLSAVASRAMRRSTFGEAGGGMGRPSRFAEERALRLGSGQFDAEFFGEPLPYFLGQAVMDAPRALFGCIEHPHRRATGA